MTSTKHHRYRNHFGTDFDTNTLLDGTLDAPAATASGSTIHQALVDLNAAIGGGGGGGGHSHETEQFAAGGGSPETFTLAFTPLYGARVFVEGLRASPDNITVVGMDVTVDTNNGDVVVIDYERAE